MTHTIGPWTPRINLIRGACYAFERAAARGEMTYWNAEKNIEDLDYMFPGAKLLEWCKQTGIEPVADFMPKLGPWYPPTHPRLRHWRTSAHARPHYSWRDYQGEPCEHRWIVAQMGGYDCNDCFKHFGAWD